MVKIFLSYRRDDSRHISERICERLAQRFGGKNVFKDVDSISVGHDFRPALDDALGRCDVLLAVIGRSWLTIADETGKRRLEDANDYVRREVETPLARGIPVVPVLVDGAKLPKSEDLPPGLQALAFRQATEVRGDPFFGGDVERLLDDLAESVSRAKAARGIWPRLLLTLQRPWHKASAMLQGPGRRGILLGLVCAVLAWGLMQWPPVGRVEEFFQDAILCWRGVRPTACQVEVIGLDDASLDEMKKPLTHASPELADVVAFAKAQGAAAIGLDVMIPNSLFAMPDLQADGPGDATRLGKAIEEAGNVVLPVLEENGRLLEPLMQWRHKMNLNPGPTDVGLVNLTEDDDKHVRRQQILFRNGEELARLHFSLALYAQGRDKVIEWDSASQTVLLSGDQVPLDEEQKLRINFVGPPGTFRVIPFRAALAAARRGDRWSKLDGRIVIIGQTAGQQDAYATPYTNSYAWWAPTDSSRLMSGCEILANVVATLHDRAFIKTMGRPVSAGILLAMGAILGWVLAQLNLAWGFAVALGHHFAWQLACYAALAYFCLRMEIVPMLALGMLILVTTIVVKGYSNGPQRERNQARRLGQLRS